MSFDGKYNLTIQTPMGAQESVLTLTQSGSELTGTMERSGDSRPIKNGKVDGEKATWEVDVTNPMPLTLAFEGEKNGDALTGSVKLGAFGKSSFEGAPA